MRRHTRTLPRARRGLGLLALVLFLGAIASVFVFAYHFLWRGSSRTLFSVQEQRELVNVARSAVAETYYELQLSMDDSGSEWVDWSISDGEVAERLHPPLMTRENAELMSADPTALRYEVDPVKIRRVTGLTLEQANQGKMGLVDLEVVVGVRREAPRHEARLITVARHAFRFAQNVGPFGGGGRHVVLTPTPVATWMEAR
jgi:hypothetical protein